MSNNAKNRFGLSAAAANCKKVLKNLKIRTAVISACALTASAVAIFAAVSADADNAALTAAIAEPSSAAAVITKMPPKEYKVNISVDGQNIGVKCAGTVSDALAAADVEVFDDDLINIGFNEPLNNNTKIVINRVDIVEEVQVEVIEYATKYREDDEHLVGYSETVVDGEEGEVETTLRHVYIDGELVSTAVIDEDITEPVDEIVVVGTKEEEPEPIVIYDSPVPAAETPNSSNVKLDENGVPAEYEKILTGTGTAYTASAGAVTSTGKKPTVGMVAVDPDIIPYGTELYVVAADGSRAYGYAIAADTGGALVNGTVLVDLYMNTESECYDWGRRKVNVYILN